MAATSNPSSGEDVAADRLEFWDRPNYTQVPNHFLDEIMTEITSLGELKVTLVVLRATFGWDEPEYLLPLDELQRRTGMARQSVVDGVAKAIERGYVGRRRTRDGFVYGTRVRGRKSRDSGPAESPVSRPPEVQKEDPAHIRRKKATKEKQQSGEKDRIQKAFDFWLTVIGGGVEANRYKLTKDREKALKARLADSESEEIRDAMLGAWHDEWCQQTGKWDIAYCLRSRDLLEQYRDKRARQLATANGASSNGNGQPPSAHPEYDTTWKNPIVEAIKLIDGNGPRTANEVARALDQELEPTREMLMGMVEDGDCVYEPATREAGEGTYARPGEAM